MTTQAYWDLSGRDVVPDLSPGATARDVGAAILHGMLQAHGSTWQAPYDTVRSKLKIRNKPVAPELQEQANQRFRTYKTLFRGLGILYDEDGHLKNTDLGSALLQLMDEQYEAVDDFGRQLAVTSRGRLARLVAPALARYQLASPITSAKYPPDTDIRPLMAIWRAMRALDNKLHWEELGRALTPCLKDEDVESAIEAIRAARADPTFDPRDPSVMDGLLGPRQPDAGAVQSDRLDTWFSRAAFKGLLLEPRDRPDGYRYLTPEHIPLLDEILADPPPFNPTTDVGDYVRWIGEVSTFEAVPPRSDAVTQRVVQKCRRYGHRQIVALVGPAGTGKTRAAQRAALILADGDSSRIETVQFHAGFTYEEFIGGLAPTDDGFAPALGALLSLNARALSEPEQTYVLVIDELSRADIANVLGELLTYIEYRDRPFSIPVFDQPFSIASNLLIIATMNPADRSVVNMDDALVRRLRQVPVTNDSGALREILSDSGMASPLADQVVGWFDGLPGDVPFGHGAFVGVRDEHDLHELWHEMLQFFLRRGGMATYPNPTRVEDGYIWRMPVFDPGAVETDDAAPSSDVPTQDVSDVAGDDEADGTP